MLVQWRGKQHNISGFYVAIMIGTFVRLVLMPVCSSDYQNKLFYPFVSDFIQHGGNIYQRTWESGVHNAFPYACVMLLVESIGVLPLVLFKISNIYLVNFFFKVPSLLFDLIILVLLVKMCPEKRRYIVVFYYLSPMVIYSVYMHGQLDLIPTGMLMISLFLLTGKKLDSKKLFMSAVFMALAMLCKLHILAALPIALLYISKREGYEKTIIFGLITGLFTVMGMLPFWSDGFVNGVLLNTEQSVITKVVFSFATVEMYIPVVAVLFVYLLTFVSSYINKDLFINLCGIVFCSFLVFCPPMPAWYVWIVPFIALYFADAPRDKYKNIAIYIILNVWYLLYFVLFHDKGMVDLYFGSKSMNFIKIDNNLLSNGLFSLMSGTLIYLIISMYQNGVASNSLYKRKNVPFTIGISGDSGSGKSTMIELIENILGSRNIQYIEGDGDHRWERGSRYWDEYTALNPKANHLYRQAEDLRNLRGGESVRRVDYDHSTGKFTAPQKIRAKKYVILCGLHSMYLPQTRKYLDLKIYMDSDETLRRYWKIQRDTMKRGHSKDKVMKSIEERMPDAVRYIYPQKEFADFVVHYYDKKLLDCMVDEHEVQMNVKLTIDSSVNVEPLMDALHSFGISADYDYSDDLRKIVVDFDNDGLDEIEFPIGEIAEAIIPQLDEITRESLDRHRNGKDAIITLFLLLLISNKMKESVN